MKNIFKLNSSGLTMTELLITIAVIAILSSAVVAVYPFIFSESRNTERKDDLSKIQSELERYYNINKVYPDPATYTLSEDDPDPTKDYCYSRGSSGKSYELFAKLERSSDGPYTCSGDNTYNYRLQMK